MAMLKVHHLTGHDRFTLTVDVGRRSRTAKATRPADADDSILNLQGSFPAAAARSGGRIVRAVVRAYTAARGNLTPASRPVRAAGGVCTGRRYEVVRKGRSAGW